MGDHATSKDFYVPRLETSETIEGLFMTGPQLPMSPEDAYECGLPTEDTDRRQAARMILREQVESGDWEREMDDYHRFQREAQHDLDRRTQAAHTRQEGDT